MKKTSEVFFVGSLVVALTVPAGRLRPAAPQSTDFEALPFAPKHAICYRTPSPLTIDGKPEKHQGSACRLPDGSWKSEG